MIEIINRIEQFRQAFNNNTCGLGFDRYRKDILAHYAEAYALWGKGYLLNYKMSGKSSFLNKAKGCANWLLNNTKHGYNYPCWGLPWAWDTWNVPRETGYLITTVMVGNFFLELYLVTNDFSYLSFAEKIARWISEENKGENKLGGFYYYYANTESLKFFIPNPSAKASGFLFQLGKALNSKDILTKAKEAMIPIQNCQLSNGGWNYSEYSAVKDVTHNGFICDGLFQAYQATGEDSYKLAFLRGVEFLKNELLLESGAMRNQARYSITDLAVTPFLEFSYKQFLRLIPMPKKYLAPLWGYASAIRVFTHASLIKDDYKEIAKAVYDWIINNLHQSDGSFLYSLKERHQYIRHLAHIYQAISYLNLTRQEQNSDES